MKEISMNDFSIMKTTTMRCVGIALLWISLAVLVYVPSTAGGMSSSIIAALGFLCFASGLGLFAEGLKREIVEEIRHYPDHR